MNQQLMKQVSEPNIEIKNGQTQQNNKTQYENIPILYAWFGKTVPQDYLISLSQLNYPVIFLKNPKISRKFNRQLLDIEKSDYFRLWYLYQNGGIYSDFDNTIDYPCLMKILEPYRKQDKLIFMTDNRHTRQKTQQITTNLIFAPYKNMPILKKMLDSIDQSAQRVWNFAGIKFVGQFSQPTQMEMQQCIKHSYDWSWFSASNQVLGLNAQAHPHYAKKLVKKEEILAQKQKLQIQLKQQISENKYLQADLKRKSHQKAAYLAELKNIQNKILQICPLASQILNEFKYQKQQDQRQEDETFIQNPATFPQTEKNMYNNQLGSQQRINLWKKINNLEQFNDKLEYENQIYQKQIYSVIIVVLFLLVFMIYWKKQKNKTKFKKLQTHQRSQYLQQ